MKNLKIIFIQLNRMCNDYRKLNKADQDQIERLLTFENKEPMCSRSEQSTPKAYVGGKGRGLKYT